MKRTCIHGSVEKKLDYYTMYEPNSGCWLWTGAVDKDGYGKLTVKYRYAKAHRESYELHKGPIPDGLVVCHRCDVPGCINPDHLFLGTNADNTADRDAKGRHVPNYGEANGSAKLTAEKVRAIRAERGLQRVVADKYGISQTAVSLIKLKQRWAHV